MAIHWSETGGDLWRAEVGGIKASIIGDSTFYWVAESGMFYVEGYQEIWQNAVLEAEQAIEKIRSLQIAVRESISFLKNVRFANTQLAAQSLAMRGMQHARLLEELLK